MEVATIQDKINEKAKAQAEENWKEAEREVRRLLWPFLKTLHSQGEIRSFLANLIDYSSCQVYFTKGVPKEYIAATQEEATENFMHRVEDLEKEVEALKENL